MSDLFCTAFDDQEFVSLLVLDEGCDRDDMVFVARSRILLGAHDAEKMQEWY